MLPHSRLPRFSATALSLALAAMLHASPALAADPFVLKDIRVEGLQRTDAGTVFASLPFRVGDTYTDEKGAAALRALFATGLFKDVRIEIEGGIVVVIVDERSVIANIDFVGLKEFDKDVLIKSLKDFGIGDGLPFDKALADRAEQELKRQYLTRSLYGAEVVTTVTPLERNRVNVTFTITEGAAAAIREIRIVGNKVFSEKTLKDLFDLNDGSWLNWYTKANRYSRAKLNADLETLRAYYLTEGQPFIVTSVRLEGEYLGKEDDFKTLVTIKPGEPYRAEQVADTTRAFTERFGSFGFAFARRGPRDLRSGRPDDHDQGKADRQPVAGRGLLERRPALADRFDQAGERLRVRQLPRHRGQHQPVAAHGGRQHGRSLLHDRRRLAGDRPLLPNGAAAQQPG
jgi:outer membrane protein insertion porin family